MKTGGRDNYRCVCLGPSKMTYVYNGICVKWSRIKWYTRSICTLLYINFDGLYIIMNSPYRSLCTKFIIYSITSHGYPIVCRSPFMAPINVWTRIPTARRTFQPLWKRVNGSKTPCILNAYCSSIHTAFQFPCPFIIHWSILKNVYQCLSIHL